MGLGDRCDGQPLQKTVESHVQALQIGENSFLIRNYADFHDFLARTSPGLRRERRHVSQKVEGALKYEIIVTSRNPCPKAVAYPVDLYRRNFSLKNAI